MDNNSRITDKVHEVASGLGYVKLSDVLRISKEAAWKKIKKKQYTLKDADKLFNGTVILSRK